ncbi:hypothetical protein NHX12_009605 [Muraenolepis orangiensis]|uniref:Uncharacterized protein n=1 Tax=Muraenolepis orangiensis TaxID=630683 RepID=A0A9Q0DJJ5_9TELE|nr:hypothetical protein NHX12_009605 [Muraenolepis orangiensis]
MSKKDPGYLDSSVRIVPDSCGVYGTFYVDLVGGGLKSFNSPARRPRMHHGPPDEQQQQHHPQQPHHRDGDDGGETIRIAGGPVAKTTAFRDALPWKQAVPPRPRMGVLREPWEKSQSKQELHAVKSGYPEGVRLVGSPRLLHYSASLHPMDMLPSPPPPPPREEDTHSLSSDDGSSRSTKLTVDSGSVRTVSTASGQRGGPPAGPLHDHPEAEADGPSYSRQSTASYCPSLDRSAMTSQEATQYLELSHQPERLRPSGWRQARLWSTPSSCYSEPDGGSVWSTWGSLTEGRGSPSASARTSVVSSVDGSSVSDGNFGHFMTLTSGGSVSGASLSDFSPPASPLSGLFPPFYSEEASGVGAERAPIPAWEWNMAWLEEMEARYRAQGHGVKPFDA